MFYAVLVYFYLIIDDAVVKPAVSLLYLDRVLCNYNVYQA